MLDKVPLDVYAQMIREDQSLFTYEVFRTVSPGQEYHHNWHIDCIIEHLQAVERGEIKRLVINMPPRSLKSICVTVAWSAWLLGHDPTRQIMAASYAKSLSTKHNQDTRLVIQQPWFQQAFPTCSLSGDQNEKAKFVTNARGHRIAVAVRGGSSTGEGGDFLIADDLLRPDEAVSDTIRGATNNWVRTTFLNRANNPYNLKAVIVAQRVHVEDPCGWALEGGGWHHLCLPAEFNNPTTITINNKSWIKNEGELLDPVRLDKSTLESIRNDMGSYQYAGQYLQSPAPLGGGVFRTEWLQYYDNMDANFGVTQMNIYILYDPANTEKAKRNHDPDYTAIIVVGLNVDNNYYILDIVRDRFNPTARIHKLFEIHKKWNKKSGKSPIVVAEQYGMMTDNFFFKKYQQQINYRFPLVEVKGRLSKNDRIMKAIPIFEGKRLYLPLYMTYVNVENQTVDLTKEFVEEELAFFPVARHDDMLDAFTRIFDESVGAFFPAVRSMSVSNRSHTTTVNDFMAW